MANLLKNEVSEEVVEDLARRFATHGGASFDSAHFAETAKATLQDLELKERINLVADTICTSLDLDYVDALAVVVEVSKGGLSEWAAWPLCSFVERHGLAHPDESLAAMEHLTQAWSCEFAIRPYLEDHLELARKYLEVWTSSPNELVRRLPSEGTRPLLPWGPKVAALTEDPSIGIDLISALRHDESETVRRSVANHLNDVAKAHPQLVVDTLTSWSTDSEAIDPKLVRHALRTLVKKGYPGALSLLGFTTNPQIDVSLFTCSPGTISLGESIELGTVLTSTDDADQLLVVDFVVHHVTARGTTSAKVFKWKTVTLKPGRSATLSKRRTIKNASTRTYHAGLHRVDLQVAGHVVATTSFSLEL